MNNKFTKAIKKIIIFFKCYSGKIEKDLTKMITRFTLALSGVAVMIALSFKYSQYGNQLKINDYLGYTASFGGAILGAMTSLIILYVTINKGNEEYEENKLNSVMPILKISRDFNSQLYDYVLDADILKSNNTTKEEIRMRIKNIGIGTARNIKIKFNDSYLTNQGKLIGVFDLGANESTNIIVRIENIKNIEMELGDNKYISTVIEYVDVYNKRKYEHKFKVIKLLGNSSFDIYETEKVDIKGNIDKL